MTHRSLAALLLALATLLAAPLPSSAADRPDLTAEQRQWLTEEGLLIRKEEKKEFLALKESYQRDEFIRKWWQARDPDPGTPQNEFKEAWEARLDEVRSRYGNMTEDRARAFLLHGEPADIQQTVCQLFLWPMEIWTYTAGPGLPDSFVLIFYQLGGGGPFRLWRPEEGFTELEALYHDISQSLTDTDQALFFQTLYQRCGGKEADTVARAIQAVLVERSSNILDLIDRPPNPRDSEWMATFRANATDLPKGAAALAARLDLGFPAREGSQTVVQGVLAVPAVAAKVAQVAGQGSYSFLLTGEVLRQGTLLESFRYRFDVPSASAGAAIPIAFERKLRPGHYDLIVKLDDVNGGGVFRERRAIDVPAVASEGAPLDPAVAKDLAAARRDLSGSAPGTSDAAALRLLPLGRDVATGPVRVEAKTEGDAVQKVSFFLDGKALLTKARPPWSVDVNLGDLPTPHTLRAVGLDAQGKEVAADELSLNEAAQRFAVHLLEPQHGAKAGKTGAPLRARAEVRVPDGRVLDRVELYVGDRRVATLYQPPFSQTLPAAASQGARFVRAVAYLKDGESAEDTVLFDAPGYSEQVEVQLVEVYAAVKDASRRPIGDLKASDFRVRDGGAPQEILRFEKVADLPISTALLIDTSSSMVKSLPQAREAALALVGSLKPQDRAAVIPFNEQPRLAVKLTGDAQELHRALAGLSAIGGTAVYDSLVFALHYLQGVRGERAVLLLTDGGDRSSHFSFDEALAYARRAGVTIYSIGLGIPRIDLLARRDLSKLASDTGGRSWFVDTAAELHGVFADIAEDLRSRYLLAYQPSPPGKPGEFRPVSVEVDRPGAEVEAMTGYFP